MKHPNTLYHHHPADEWETAPWDRLFMLPGVTGARIRFNVPGRHVASRGSRIRKDTAHVVHDYDHPVKPYRIAFFRCRMIDEAEEAALTDEERSALLTTRCTHVRESGRMWDVGPEDLEDVEPRYETPAEAIMAGLIDQYYEDAPAGVDVG